jgi:hypothetical protein
MALSPYEETILDFIYIAKTNLNYSQQKTVPILPNWWQHSQRMWKKFPMRSRFGATPVLTS